MDDDFFGFGRNPVYRTFIARSAPLTLEVLSLPDEGRPADFTGYVGRLKVATTADPTQISVGDPITLTISISGSDYLEQIDLPPLSQNPLFHEDFKIPEEIAAGTIKNGDKVFTQTIRAKNADVKEIPPVELSYFDPDAKTYRVARSNAIPIQVKEARVVTAQDAEGKESPPSVKNELEAWSQGIAHNYEGPEVLEDQAFSVTSALRNPLWMGALTIPFFSYLLILVYVQARRRKMADPALHRSRTAYARFKKNIGRLKSIDRTSPEAFGALLDSVRQYLGDKLRINGIAMTYADIRNRLESRDIDSQLLNQLEDFFVLCEQGSYGGNSSFPKSFDELLQSCSQLIRKLESEL
jgi:hypothetical protein